MQIFSFVKLKNFRVDQTEIKLIGVLLMLLDHLWTFFYNYFPIWFTEIGRVVAPLFLYISIFGFFKSSNQLKYIYRLLFAGIIMGILNLVFRYLLYKLFNLELLFTFFVPNIFLSLGLSLALIYLFEKIKNSTLDDFNPFHLAFFVFALAGFLVVEGGVVYFLMTIIFYVARQNKKLISLFLIGLSIFLYVQFNYLNNFMWIRPDQWMQVFVIPLIYLYSGEKSKLKINEKLNRYFFYFFYPAHLYLIGLAWVRWGVY